MKDEDTKPYNLTDTVFDKAPERLAPFLENMYLTEEDGERKPIFDMRKTLVLFYGDKHPYMYGKEHDLVLRMYNYTAHLCSTQPQFVKLGGENTFLHFFWGQQSASLSWQDFPIEGRLDKTVYYDA